jgi:RNA 2',3'-cyclic 3'-phosphodiesterase
MKRLFAAVHVSPSKEFRELFSSLQRGLRFADIKWASPENIHITLKFFGETSEDRIPDISRVFKSVSQRHSAFGFTIAETGIFGSSYNPRVVWFGIKNAGPLTALAQDVLKDVESIGWERDRQNFVPHITVGRVKDPKDKWLFQKMIDENNKAFIQEVSVTEFRLYESILQREGPIYKVLESYPLRG